MFERFTEKAIKVIMVAQEEARRMAHNYVSTEFILLGLIGEKSSIAGKTLHSMGVNLKDARVEVEKVLGKGVDDFAVEIPFTSSAKRTLELSWEEARNLGHNYIGTEHLLLGLISEGKSNSYAVEKALDILQSMDVDVEVLRMETIAVLNAALAAKNSTSQTETEERRLDGKSLTVIRGAMRVAVSAIKHAEQVAKVEQALKLASWLREREIEFSRKASEFHKQALVSQETDKVLAEEIFPRFTEKALKVYMLAQEEARRLGHNFVGTEQILLGLIGEGSNIAAKALKSEGINIRQARVEVEKIIGRGPCFVTAETEIPNTPRARRVLDFSLMEAELLGHNYIGPEHILLGLIREGDGVAVRVLENLGADGEKLGGTLMRYLGEGGTDTA